MIGIAQFYQSYHNIAAIDLGSNALRVIVIQQNQNSIKILKNLRFPIRLGDDVFKYKKISPHLSLKLKEIFVELLYLFSEFHVCDVFAVATSAMRDAQNGRRISREIFELTGIKLQIISGTEEAKIISSAVCDYLPSNNKLSLIMDIGGGSTEIILVKNKKIIAAKSFNLGTVRLINSIDQNQFKKKILSIKEFIFLNSQNKKIHHFFGTGGNLRRMAKAKNFFLKKKSSRSLNKKELHFIKQKYNQLDEIDIFEKLKFDKNKIDVFLPALEITSAVQELISISSIQLPPIGLKEGLILRSLQDKKLKKKFIKESLKSLE
jgi:exopolyphosphatase/guanosine-5'-triphosphate,3'-diphosphate pyrophosphatase